MPLVALSGKNLRNLSEYSINPSPNINIILGKNGAGKTSLLEGVYLNVLGRSFRTSTTRNIINDNSDGCWTFAQYKNTNNKIDRIGVERKKGNHQSLSINGIHHQSLLHLASIVPTLAIQPSESLLVDGASSYRRKYLDWVLFHVEPSFLECWRNNQKLLKQRNMLLRRLSKKRTTTKADLLELKVWDKGFVSSCLALSEMRERISQPLQHETSNYLSRMPAFNEVEETSVNIAFYHGWVKDTDLEAALEIGLEQDIKKGFSRIGSHRCDLLMTAKNNAVKEYLSRGQKKLLAMAMCLAQAKVLSDQEGKKSILLLDDVFSELDEANAQAFVKEVEALDTQVFLTCLHTNKDVAGMFSKEIRMFHVEQGRVSLLKS